MSFPRVTAFLQSPSAAPTGVASAAVAAKPPAPSPFTAPGSAELKTAGGGMYALRGEWRLTQVERRSQMYDAGAPDGCAAAVE